MRRICTMLVGISLVCGAGGCISSTSHYQSPYDTLDTSRDSTFVTPLAAEKPSHVTVEMDGDVRFHGQRKIKRELSSESVLQAAGGFGGLSSTPPQSITLIRGSQNYLIPFAEMGQGIWKNFSLADGDRIIVNLKVF